MPTQEHLQDESATPARFNQTATQSEINAQIMTTLSTLEIYLNNQQMNDLVSKTDVGDPSTQERLSVYQRVLDVILLNPPTYSYENLF